MVTFANSFDGIGFGWRFGGPDVQKQGGLVLQWSGEIELDTRAHFSSLFALLRPVNVRVIANVSGFVDFWDTGTSPIHDLVMVTYDAGGTPTTETRSAILSECKQGTLRPDGSVRATATFTAVAP